MSPPNKPDFSNVKSGVSSTEQERPDFGNVRSGVSSTEEPRDAAPRTYTVAKGDTLSKIAKQFYGNAAEYPRIFEANKPMLTHPDKIYPGQNLRIPPK